MPPFQQRTAATERRHRWLVAAFRSRRCSLILPLLSGAAAADGLISAIF
jgi:hypothetical protein